MVLKVVLSRVPTRVNAAIAATATSAAINAYSIAATPRPSCSNLWSRHMQKTIRRPTPVFSTNSSSRDKPAVFDRDDHLADRPQSEAGELQMRPGEGQPDDRDRQTECYDQMGEGEPPSRQHEPDQIADGAERTGPDILVPGVVGAVDRRLAERQEGGNRNVKRPPPP